MDAVAACFNVQSRMYNSMSWYRSRDSQLWHIFLAREGSEVGKAINDLAINKIIATCKSGGTDDPQAYANQKGAY